VHIGYLSFPTDIKTHEKGAYELALTVRFFIAFRLICTIQSSILYFPFDLKFSIPYTFGNGVCKINKETITSNFKIAEANNFLLK